MLYIRFEHIYNFKSLTPAGFEPAPPKRKQLKCFALDHSATVSSSHSGARTHDLRLIRAAL